MHPSTFEYLKPTDLQIEQMSRIRAAAKAYCDVLEQALPDGPDKTFIMRNHRSNAMWANVVIARLPDGTPLVKAMKKQIGKIPIKAAADIAKQYGLKQCLLIGWDGELVHIVTWGETKEGCEAAAKAQDFWTGKIREFSFKGDYTEKK